jgi:hypothetical protein
MFEQMEQWRRLTESPFQKMIEQQQQMQRALESPIQNMIEQEQQYRRGIVDAFAPNMQSLIDQQERIRDVLEPFSKQMEALDPVIKGFSEVADQLTSRIIKQMQNYESLISAIENPMTDWIRTQDHMEKLSRAIEQTHQEAIRPLFLPVPRSNRKRKKSAERFCKRVIASVRKIEDTLQEDEWLIIFTHTEAGEIIFIQRMAYQNPNLIVLYGFDREGRDHQIATHMKAVQLHFRIEKDPDSEKGKNRWVQ